jgi:hypothetical protein
MAKVFQKLALQKFDPRPGAVDRLRALEAGEILRQSVEINHCCKPGFWTLVLLHPKYEVLSQVLITAAPAPVAFQVVAEMIREGTLPGIASVAPSSGRDAMGIDDNLTCCKFVAEDVVHERLFGLAFHDEVQADQR